jgi:hypothetical protein
VDELMYLDPDAADIIIGPIKVRVSRKSEVNECSFVKNKEFFLKMFNVSTGRERVSFSLLHVSNSHIRFIF